MALEKDPDLEKTLELVRSAQAGDASALDELFRRHAPRVRQIVAMRLGRTIRDFSTCDDLAQDAMLRALKGLDRFEERSVGTFRNWLSRCVESAITDHFRARQRLKRGSGKVRAFSEWGTEDLRTSIFAGKGPTPSQVAMGQELEDRLEQAMLDLPEHYREVIILRKLCGMSYSEIVEALAIEREGTARQLVFKALEKLGQRLGLE